MFDPPPGFFETCAAIGVKVSRDDAQALGRYLHLLLETNKQFNLTAIREPYQAWHRHIIDSLSVVPLLEGVSTLIDVGSGGGLPGVPVAIMRPQVQVTLLEATGKKARFLQSVADELGRGNVRVIQERAETVGQDPQHRQAYDVAVCRAVGPLNVLLELTLPLVKVGGRVLAMKGRRLEAELDSSLDAISILGGGEFRVFDALPEVNEEAVIVEVDKVQPTPRAYPRRPGVPKMEPL